jgi:hypothetical protein
MLDKLRTYSSWIALALIPLLGASYWYACIMLREQRPWELLNISNLTVNYLITFVIIGWLGEKLGKRYFPAKRPLHLAARWGIWAMFLLGLVLWLKLWGYEMRI